MLRRRTWLQSLPLGLQAWHSTAKQRWETSDFGTKKHLRPNPKSWGLQLANMFFSWKLPPHMLFVGTPQLASSKEAREFSLTIHGSKEYRLRRCFGGGSWPAFWGGKVAKLIHFLVHFPVMLRNQAQIYVIMYEYYFFTTSFFLRTWTCSLGGCTFIALRSLVRTETRWPETFWKFCP